MDLWRINLVQERPSIVLELSEHQYREKVSGLFVSSKNKPDTFFTSDLIPTYGRGPGAEKLRGIYPNTHLYWVMRETLETGL
jgi:alkaline phosphatase